MGNSSSSAFESGVTVTNWESNVHWTMTEGFRKEDKEEVAIFKYLKTQKDKILPAQRCILKMKTLRHPYILSYVESAEYDDSLVLVTEGCIPLVTWLSNAAKNKDKAGGQDGESLQQELLWGLKCVLEALQFLHSNGLVHSYLGIHAIFVAKSGDWKIGALDLLGNMTSEDDFNFLKNYACLLCRPYICPERQQPLVYVSDAEKTSKLVAVGSGADIFALAHCIEKSFATADLAVPEGLSKYFSRMLSVDPKRRPTASQLAKCPVFTSDSIKLMASLGDLAALKPAAESLEILGRLSENVEKLPVSICVHKILPSLARTLQMACTDFNNRDSRESCRQSIQLCLSMLSRLAEHGKIGEEQYSKHCVTSVLTLWTMTDRTIRTALLGTLKNLVTLTPADMVNKNIFDPLLAGFADSNAKMREETLKCLVHVVEKLDEKHLQEKLVRCILNLQNDSENSIRTNATIFLGRIAVKLKESVRVRVLCTSFSKAMRDGFVHCRVAGLKAATACITLLDHGQLTTKVLPQVCSLLLDRSADVRELALKFLDQGVALMKEQHKALCMAEKKAAAAMAAAGESPGKTGTAASEKAPESMWAPSWTSLSQTLEKIAIGGPTTVPSGAGSGSGATVARDEDSLTPRAESRSMSLTVTSADAVDARSRTASIVQKVVMADGWGDDGGFDDWDDNNGNNNPGTKVEKNKMEKSGGGWGEDDDIDFDGDDSGNGPPSPSPSPPISASSSAPSTPIKGLGLTPKTSRDKPAAVLPPKSKKLPVSTGPSTRLAMGSESADNWDDF